MVLNSQGFGDYGFFDAFYGTANFISVICGALLPFIVIGLVAWLVVKMIQHKED